MTPQISLAHLARPGASRIIVPFFSATASGLEPPRPAAAAAGDAYVVCGSTRDDGRTERVRHGPAEPTRGGRAQRQPLAERPIALEITEAQGMIGRFDGFEQLAAAYLSGQSLTAANPAEVRPAVPGKRLETALVRPRFQPKSTGLNNLDVVLVMRRSRWTSGWRCLTTRGG
jgi:hypothetical protein